MRPVTFWLPPEDWQAMGDLAVDLGVSRSELLRRLVSAELRTQNRPTLTRVQRKIQQARWELVIDGD
jgi:hypothetical protein